MIAAVENEECAEEDGEANGDWLKVSVCCAVKQKTKKPNEFNAAFILVIMPKNKFVEMYLLGCFQETNNFLA